MKVGCKYGTHRVIEPETAFPQSCWRIDNTMDPIYDNEILVDVKRLNVDAASFHQMAQEADGNPYKIGEIILRTVAQRGKQHNPITGSGGMFTGVVNTIGAALKDRIDLNEGDRIASLVSLSLTPLQIKRIKHVNINTDQVEIDGKAILFEKTVFEKLSDSISEDLATAVFDVAGAPAQTAKLVKNGQTVLVVGAGGKSGLLSSYIAKQKAGPSGTVIGTGHSAASTKRVERIEICDHVIQVDATQPKALEGLISDLTGGKMADVTLNCASVPDTELSCILATNPRGLIYFFNMATNFSKAALGAEGIGSQVTMIIGNGYVENHAKFAIKIIEQNKAVRKAFESIFQSR